MEAAGGAWQASLEVCVIKLFYIIHIKQYFMTLFVSLSKVSVSNVGYLIT